MDQEVGHLRRLVEREDGDNRPLALRWPQRIDRARVFGFLDGCRCRERGWVVPGASTIGTTTDTAMAAPSLRKIDRLRMFTSV